MRDERVIYAGSDFSMIFTALREEIDIPAILPDPIPQEWFDDLSGYEILAQLSTTEKGRVIISSTQNGKGDLLITRHDKARFSVNVPHELTAKLSEGHIVLTVQLIHKESGRIAIDEKVSIPIVRPREIRL